MRKADKHGPGGSAWRCGIKPTTKDHEAGLGSWIIHQPGVHAFWSYWIVALVHLRPIESVRPAHKAYPEAEYEMLCLSLNPEHDPPDPDGGEELHFLTPPDWVHQFHGVTDTQAVEMFERLVEECVAGRLAADSDFGERWKASIWATVEHLTTGHPQGSA